MGWSNFIGGVTDAAQSAANFGKGVGTGVWDGAASLVTGIKDLAVGGYNLATEPAARERAKQVAAQAVDYGGRLVDDPATRSQAYDRVQNFVGDAREQFVTARDRAAQEGRLADFYGQVAGRGGFEVAAMVVPVTKLGVAAKTARAAEAADAVADTTRVTRVAEVFGEVKIGTSVRPCSDLGRATAVASPGFETSNLQRKLKDYLLDPAHPQNQTKATWFDDALGFNKENWQDLASQLKFDETTATQTKLTKYGTTYEQVIPIAGANGKTVSATFVFMKDNNGVVRFVTGIPTKR